MQIYRREQSFIEQLGEQDGSVNMNVRDVGNPHPRRIARAGYPPPMDDPRRLLESAAEQRLRVEILPRSGPAGHGQLVRLERGGVVVVCTPPPPAAGTDVRCWISVGGRSFTFEASVLRLGVPVPDRSQSGILLGFVDGFRPADGEAGTLVLEALSPGGGVVSLHDAEVRIIDLQPEEWTISSPSASRVVFVEGGTLRLRLATPGRSPIEVGGVVRELSRSANHLLYRIGIEEVANAAEYRECLAAVRASLEI